MLGERIAALRKEQKITQAYLADYLGMTQTAIWKYEKEQTEPDIASLIKMADLFKVSVDYLIGRTDVREYGKQSTPTEREEEIKAAQETLKDPNNWIQSQEQISATVLRELVRAEVQRAMAERNKADHPQE